MRTAIGICGRPSEGQTCSVAMCFQGTAVGLEVHKLEVVCIHVHMVAWRRQVILWNNLPLSSHNQTNLFKKNYKTYGKCAKQEIGMCLETNSSCVMRSTVALFADYSGDIVFLSHKIYRRTDTKSYSY